MSTEDAKHSACYLWSKIRDRNRPTHPTVGERRAFEQGWDAAMKFMSSPRMPAPSTGTPLPTAPTTGEPIPLVAFYTDAP